MELQVSYFKSKKTMLWKCCTRYPGKSGSLSSGHRTGKGQFSFQLQRKVLPKNAQTISSVQFSHSVVSDSLWPYEPQQTRLPCPSPTPRAHPNLCPRSRWCHPTISSSVAPFLSCPQSFRASESFQMSELFASGGQSIRVSASTSVLLTNTQNWSPSGWTGWISLQSKGLSRVFCNTTIQKHQFLGVQPFMVQLSHLYMTTGKTIALTK